MENLNLSEALPGASDSEKIAVLLQNVQALQNKVNEIVSDMNKSFAGAYIYPQVDVNRADNKIHIKASPSLCDTRGLIYVLPYETIENAGTYQSKLVLDYGSNSMELTILKEKFEGGLCSLDNGDISANHLCVFRMNPLNRKEVILVNARLSGSASLNKATISEASFLNVPKIYKNSLSDPVNIATMDDIEKVYSDLQEKYQKKIRYGTDTVVDFLKKNSLSEGEVYVQVEE